MRPEYIALFVGLPLTMLAMGVGTFVIIHLDRPRKKRKS